MKKRLFTIILALILCLAVSLPALAADDYPSKYRDVPKDSVTDEWRFYNRECVSFVAWCLNSRNHVAFSNYMRGVWWGNANTWDDAARALGYTVDRTPAVGAVAYWESGYYGHVAWVSAITWVPAKNGYRVTVEEYNYDYDGTYHTRTIEPDAKDKPAGYIHIKDIVVAPPPPPVPSVTFKEWNEKYLSYVTETDAILGQEITVVNGNCSKLGMCLYDSKGVFLAEAVNDPFVSAQVSFQVNRDCGYTLAPGTTYKYKFYAVVEGKTYWGEEASFTTLGGTPALDRDSLSLTPGGRVTLHLTGVGNQAVVWGSSDKAVATVNSGVVTAVGPGQATITAMVGGVYLECQVFVGLGSWNDPDVGGGSEVHFPYRASYTEGQFTDVSRGDWFASSVADAYELGLVVGNSDTTFNPYGSVTVAEAVTMACRIHSIYTTGTDAFQLSSPWYQEYLDYAYANGIISYELYASDVTQKATRAKFAQIFSNSLPDAALSSINRIADGAIPDVSGSAAYAGSVYRLYRAGILTGNDEKGTFRPDSSITRAEAAAILTRMADSDTRVRLSL